MQIDHLLHSYEYELPADAIAQEPTLPLEDAKMMIINGNLHQHAQFKDLAELLDDRYLLFLNTTKVFRARIPLQNVKVLRGSGKVRMMEQGEIFIYQLIGENKFEALVSDSKNFKPGSKIFFNEELYFESLAFSENGIVFSFQGQPLFDFLEQYAEMPLPPYITYHKEKEAWYQTHFAQEVGSSASPTASLHFSPELIGALKKRGVGLERLCLHVGLGTFKPISEENITQQKLHFEPMFIPHQLWRRIAEAKQAGKIFLPVGTTMVRFLESLPYLWLFLKKQHQIGLFDSQFGKYVDAKTQKWRDALTEEIDPALVEEFFPAQKLIFSEERLCAQTRLFIRPGIAFHLVDELISNFHLPKSSLLMLIAAFIGRENLLNVYQEALGYGYKFFSFGDGMWIRARHQD